MRAHRPQDTASKPRGRRFRAGVVRVLSVTAVAVTACSLWAGAASAASATTKFGTTTKITNAVPGVIHVGQTFTIHVTVTSSGGSAATGKVAVKPTTSLPAGYSCTATLSAGKGSCTVKPTEYGVVDYKATYGGDASHNGSTSSGTYPLEVKNVTTTTVGPKTAAAGTVKLTADVYAMGANITFANGGRGSLAFYNGTTVINGCAAVLLTSFTGPPHFDNVGTCSTKLAKGTYTINVVFSGDEVNEGSKGSVTLVVS